MNRVRFLKDHAGHSKGDVTELRSKEAKEAIKAEAVVILEDVDPKAFQTKTVSSTKKPATRTAPAADTASNTQTNHQTNGSSDGNTQSVRTNNSSRR